jgi:hypothetical protein
MVKGPGRRERQIVPGVYSCGHQVRAIHCKRLVLSFRKFHQPEWKVHDQTIWRKINLLPSVKCGPAPTDGFFTVYLQKSVLLDNVTNYNENCQGQWLHADFCLQNFHFLFFIKIFFYQQTVDYIDLCIQNFRSPVTVYVSHLGSVSHLTIHLYRRLDNTIDIKMSKVKLFISVK